MRPLGLRRDLVCRSHGRRKSEICDVHAIYNFCVGIHRIEKATISRLAKATSSFAIDKDLVCEFFLFYYPMRYRSIS